MAHADDLVIVARAGTMAVTCGSTVAKTEDRPTYGHYLDGTSHWSCAVGAGDLPPVTVAERLTLYDADDLATPASTLTWVTPLT